MNRKGQLLSLDLLLALVPLTMAIGMSASALSGLATQSQGYISYYSMHRQANDFMDILVKTPGDPPDWNRVLNASVNGAANYDEESDRVLGNYINARKLYHLNETELNLTLCGAVNCTGALDYNISLYIENPAIFANLINFTYPSWGRPVPEDPSELVAIERLVVVDNLLQISEDAPNALATIDNVQGGRVVNCENTTLDLTQDEINNFQFWFYVTFNCTDSKRGCPVSMKLSLNDRCDRVTPVICNDLVNQFNVPFEQAMNVWPVNNGTTTEQKTRCGPGGNKDWVEYFINQTASDPITYEMYIKVPKEFLRVGFQNIYISIQGVDTISTGWVADAPREVPRETLSEFFLDVDQYRDQKSKLVLRVWKQ